MARDVESHSRRIGLKGATCAEELHNVLQHRCLSRLRRRRGGGRRAINPVSRWMAIGFSVSETVGREVRLGKDYGFGLASRDGFERSSVHEWRTLRRAWLVVNCVKNRLGEGDCGTPENTVFGGVRVFIPVFKKKPR